MIKCIFSERVQNKGQFILCRGEYSRRWFFREIEDVIKRLYFNIHMVFLVL